MLCDLCLRRKVPKGHRTKCSRPCVVRAADLRRNGKDPVDPGYSSRFSDGNVPSLIGSVSAMAYYAESKERWDEAQAFDDAHGALVRVRGIRRARARACRALRKARA